MTTHAIRRAIHAETPRLFEICLAVTENPLIDPSRVTAAGCAWLIQHSDVWVWDEAGTIHGFSAADPRDGSIWALFVAPGQDGRGIGRGLLRSTCDTLRRRGHDAATLRAQAGTRAEAFYRAAGWQEIGRDGGRVILRQALG